MKSDLPDDTAQAGGAVGSPCINVCRIVEATGWCEGCLRTLDEIAAWSSLDDAGKLAVWRALRSRRARLRGEARAVRADDIIANPCDPGAAAAGPPCS